MTTSNVEEEFVDLEVTPTMLDRHGVEEGGENGNENERNAYIRELLTKCISNRRTQKISRGRRRARTSRQEQTVAGRPAAIRVSGFKAVNDVVFHVQRCSCALIFVMDGQL